MLQYQAVTLPLCGVLWCNYLILLEITVLVLKCAERAWEGVGGARPAPVSSNIGFTRRARLVAWLTGAFRCVVSLRGPRRWSSPYSDHTNF